MLSKDAILKAKDLPTKEINVPEWGGKVIIKTMTGLEKEEWENVVTEKKGKGKGRDAVYGYIRASLAAWVLVDDKGIRVFTNAEVPLLAKKSCAALDRIFVEAQKMNVLTDEDIEELEKNLGTGPKENSSSN